MDYDWIAENQVLQSDPTQIQILELMCARCITSKKLFICSQPGKVSPLAHLSIRICAVSLMSEGCWRPKGTDASERDSSVNSDHTYR